MTTAKPSTIRLFAKCTIESKPSHNARTPHVFFWCPNYSGDAQKDPFQCTGYVIQTPGTGFHVRYYHPNTLHVDWSRHLIEPYVQAMDRRGVSKAAVGVREWGARGVGPLGWTMCRRGSCLGLENGMGTFVGFWSIPIRKPRNIRIIIPPPPPSHPYPYPSLFIFPTCTIFPCHLVALTAPFTFLPESRAFSRCLGPCCHHRQRFLLQQPFNRIDQFTHAGFVHRFDVVYFRINPQSNPGTLPRSSECNPLHSYDLFGLYSVCISCISWVSTVLQKLDIGLNGPIRSGSRCTFWCRMYAGARADRGFLLQHKKVAPAHTMSPDEMVALSCMGVDIAGRTP